MERVSIGRDEAIKMAEARWWIGKSPRDIAGRQLFLVELCCPFEVFHEAIKKV
jgi:hypothetical protein